LMACGGSRRSLKKWRASLANQACRPGTPAWLRLLRFRGIQDQGRLHTCRISSPTTAAKYSSPALNSLSFPFSSLRLQSLRSPVCPVPARFLPPPPYTTPPGHRQAWRSPRSFSLLTGSRPRFWPVYLQHGFKFSERRSPAGRNIRSRRL
jgi:hypothetical protein